MNCCPQKYEQISISGWLWACDAFESSLFDVKLQRQSETERETERETETETETKRERETDKQRERQTQREKERERGRGRGRDKNVKIHRCNNPQYITISFSAGEWGDDIQSGSTRDLKWGSESLYDFEIWRQEFLYNSIKSIRSLIANKSC